MGNCLMKHLACSPKHTALPSPKHADTQVSCTMIIAQASNVVSVCGLVYGWQVDSIQKTGLFHRQQLLEKIMGEYERTRSMMRDRHELQEQRKMANMHASLQRQAMSQVMDSLRFSKSVGKLAGSGGGVNINELLARSRPATAL